MAETNPVFEALCLKTPKTIITGLQNEKKKLNFNYIAKTEGQEQDQKQALSCSSVWNSYVQRLRRIHYRLPS
jgi:hypothetical protein